MASAAQSMKAVLSPAKGEAVVGELPIPTIEDHDVLVKVHAAGVNPVDWKMRDYNFFGMPYPYALGFDFSGVVTAVGTAVHDYKVGDEVYGNNPYNRSGSFATFLAVHTDYIALKPKSFSHVQAASLPVAGLSAYEGLLVEAKISKGETVYIPGGAGGVGHFAVLFAKAHGARVISSGSKPASLELLRQLGADVVFDYSKQSAVDAVKAATNGQGADVAFDATYPKEWVTTARCVKAGGKLAQLGSSGPLDSADAAAILKEHKITSLQADLPRYSGGSRAKAHERVHGMLVGMAELADRGAFKPHISKVVKSLDEVPSLLHDIQKSVYSGKVVISLVD